MAARKTKWLIAAFCAVATFHCNSLLSELDRIRKKHEESQAKPGQDTTPPTADPSFSLPPGSYSSAQNLTITSSTPGATICYRTDGTDPTAPTPGICGPGSITYSGALTIGPTNSDTITFRALATKAGAPNSSVVTATYTFTEPTTPTDLAALSLDSAKIQLT